MIGLCFNKAFCWLKRGVGGAGICSEAMCKSSGIALFQGIRVENPHVRSQAHCQRDACMF